MVDTITKALNKFSKKERAIMKAVLHDIKANTLESYDVKKLKARDNIYRVRKGKIRVLFQKTKDSISILAVEKRNDHTYD